jgi:hypothetical protein
MVPVTDRPEVRTFMAAVASSDRGLGAAPLEWPLTLPVNAGFDVGNMANPVIGNIVTGIQNAIRTDSLRFDGSDNMPDDVRPAFLDGMVRLFREGSLETLDELSLDIAHDVEAAWREHEATPAGNCPPGNPTGVGSSRLTRGKTSRIRPKLLCQGLVVRPVFTLPERWFRGLGSCVGGRRRRVGA